MGTDSGVRAVSAVLGFSGKVTCTEAFVYMPEILITTCERRRKESVRKINLESSEKVSFQHSSTVVGRRVSKPPCLVPSAGRSPKWGSSMP